MKVINYSLTYADPFYHFVSPPLVVSFGIHQIVSI
jgi:hypothetical protein